jgi:hypothetical protein
MQAMVRRFYLTLTVLGIMIVGAEQAQAGFEGLTVHGEYLYPDIPTPPRSFRTLGTLSSPQDLPSTSPIQR